MVVGDVNRGGLHQGGSIMAAASDTIRSSAPSMMRHAVARPSCCFASTTIAALSPAVRRPGRHPDDGFAPSPGCKCLAHNNSHQFRAAEISRAGYCQPSRLWSSGTLTHCASGSVYPGDPFKQGLARPRHFQTFGREDRRKDRIQPSFARPWSPVVQACRRSAGSVRARLTRTSR